MDLQEKVKRVQEFRLMDDVFFEVFAKDIPACQEILRTILEDEQLIVHDVIVQSSERNLYGRSVRLDALCTLGNGSKCNIEVQRSNNDNHLKRARFNAAVITARTSEQGEKFDDVLELYIIYISEFDFLGGGLTTYHVDKTIRENGMVVDDGLHEIFVNTVIKDGSSISDLMTCFSSKEVDTPEFPAVTRRFRELKSEGGASAVCEIMEKYLSEAKNEGWTEGRAEGKTEGKTEERINTIQKMLRKGFDKQTILSLDYTEEEYQKAESSMLATV